MPNRMRATPRTKYVQASSRRVGDSGTTRLGLDGSMRVTMVVPTFHRRTRLAAEVLEALGQRFPGELSKSGWRTRVLTAWHVVRDIRLGLGEEALRWAASFRMARG